MKKTPFKIAIIIVTPFLLSSCWWLNDSNAITVHERYVSQYAYFDKYIKPTNPDADRGSFEAYQFLKKKIDNNKRTILLAAWEKFDDSGAWYIEIESERFEFICQLSISAYSFHSKDSISVQDLCSNQMFTMEELKSSFSLLTEYVNKDSENR